MVDNQHIDAFIPSVSKKYLCRILSDGEEKNEANIQLS